jgi:hypothetical protein
VTEGSIVARRVFVRSALTATLANAVSSFAQSATWTAETALLILDFQVGIGDQPYAQRAAQRASAALKGPIKQEYPTDVRRDGGEGEGVIPLHLIKRQTAGGFHCGGAQFVQGSAEAGTTGKDNRPLNEVLKLPYISRPRPTH